jgi:hypothetical protein
MIMMVRTGPLKKRRGLTQETWLTVRLRRTHAPTCRMLPECARLQHAGGLALRAPQKVPCRAS